VNSPFNSVGATVSQSGNPITPPSSLPSPTRNILSLIPRPHVGDIAQVVKKQEEIALQRTGDLVISVRSVSLTDTSILLALELLSSSFFQILGISGL
jgi:hypothetical protein